LFFVFDFFLGIGELLAFPPRLALESEDSALPLAFPRLLVELVLVFLFFAGLTSSSAEGEPDCDRESGVGVDEPLFWRLLKSETTCWRRLLAYAWRLRGAYVPLPAVTSKNSLRLPCSSNSSTLVVPQSSSSCRKLQNVNVC